MATRGPAGPDEASPEDAFLARAAQIVVVAVLLPGAAVIAAVGLAVFFLARSG